MTKSTFSLRPYLDSDADILRNFMSSGYGAALAEPGFYSPDEWEQFRSSFGSSRTIVKENGLKSVEFGFAGIKNHNIRARRAELVCFCWSRAEDRTFNDKEALSSVLDWCFDGLNLNKIVIKVLDNNRILSLLEEAGFVSEGTIKQYIAIGSQSLDCTVMGLMVSGRQRTSP